LAFSLRGVHRPLLGGLGSFAGTAVEVTDVSPPESLSGASASSTGQATVLDVQSLPFISNKDLIWMTLPGEDVRIVNGYVPFGQPGASGFARFQNAAEEGLICGAGAGGYLPETAINYVEGAIISGLRFIHGNGLWGCTEKAFLNGVTGLLTKWIADVTALQTALDYQRIHKSAPAAMPAYVKQLSHPEAWRMVWPPDALAKVQALLLELKWAREFFKSTVALINYAEQARGATDALVYDEMQSNAKLSVGYLKVDNITSQFGRATAGLVGDAEDFYEFYQQNEELLQPVVKVVLKALVDLIEALAGDSINAITDALKNAGTSVSSIPFVGTIVSFILQYVVPAIVDAYTEEGTEGPFRGNVKMGRHGVESYMQMSYRAVAQVEYMVQHLANGTHPLARAEVLPMFRPVAYSPTTTRTGPAATFRPTEQVRTDVRTVAPEDVKNVEVGAEGKLESSGSTTKKVVAGAAVVGGVGLGWWALKALGIIGRRRR
jgi:hypothetical protein